MSENAGSTTAPRADGALGIAAQRALRGLCERGRDAWLAGEPLARERDRADGLGADDGPAAGRALPSALALTDASPQEVLEHFPRGVPIATAPGVVVAVALSGETGRDRPLGTLDVHCGVALGPDALARAAFTAHAVALDAATGRAIDPFGGERDRRARVLRCAGDARAALAASPCAALRALRLVGEDGYAADEALEKALAEAAPRFSLAQRAHGRGELARMLTGRFAGRALALAERTGLAARIAPTRPGAAAWIDALPRALEPRLAAWLEGDAAAWLRDWRFGIERSQRVLDWIAHHPLERAVDPRRDAQVARLERRLGSDGLAVAFALRRAELASGVVPEANAARARAALGALEAALARVAAARARTAQRRALALSGEEVMEALGCGPGRRVGEALRHLGAFTAADPSRNTPERLRAELAAWDAACARAADGRR